MRGTAAAAPSRGRPVRVGGSRGGAAVPPRDVRGFAPPAHAETDRSRCRSTDSGSGTRPRARRCDHSPPGTATGPDGRARPAPTEGPKPPHLHDPRPVRRRRDTSSEGLRPLGLRRALTGEPRVGARAGPLDGHGQRRAAAGYDVTLRRLLAAGAPHRGTATAGALRACTILGPIRDRGAARRLVRPGRVTALARTGRRPPRHAPAGARAVRPGRPRGLPRRTRTSTARRQAASAGRPEPGGGACRRGRAGHPPRGSALPYPCRPGHRRSGDPGSGPPGRWGDRQVRPRPGHARVQGLIRRRPARSLRPPHDRGGTVGAGGVLARAATVLPAFEGTLPGTAAAADGQQSG